MAPAIFGNIFFKRTFEPIWAGPMRYPVWFAMMVPLFALLSLFTILRMRRYEVPFRLYIPTVIYSFMGSVVYGIALGWGVIIFILALIGGGMLSAMGKEDSGNPYYVCPYCGHSKPANGVCRNCGK